MTRSVEFGLGATFKEKHLDGTETQRSAVLAVGGKRDGNQARMLPPVEPPAAPLGTSRPWGTAVAGVSPSGHVPGPTGGVKPVESGVQTDYWANKRYGDKDQLPAPTVRRAGPLPFPETEEQAREAEAERLWGHWH